MSFTKFEQPLAVVVMRFLCGQSWDRIAAEVRIDKHLAQDIYKHVMHKVDGGGTMGILDCVRDFDKITDPAREEAANPSETKRKDPQPQVLKMPAPRGIGKEIFRHE